MSRSAVIDGTTKRSIFYFNSQKLLSTADDENRNVSIVYIYIYI